MKIFNKKIGIGSLSLLLFILGIMFAAINLKTGICYGDIILRFIGLNPWSNGNQGTHYTIFYSLIFFIPSIIIGFRFIDDFGAALGRGLSFAMLLLIIIASMWTAV